MRSSRMVVLLSLVVFAPLGLAENGSRTEAQQDGLLGAVKSVSTIVASSDVPWQQPGGPTLVVPVFCRDCEYSADGYRTKSGEVVDGKFIGDIRALTRDGNGRVTDVNVTNAANGELYRHMVMGPFGKTEETLYQNGKLSGASTFRYDTSGHMTDWISRDGAGAQIGRTLESWTKDVVTEQTVWGKEQQIQMRETYDPAKDEQHYSTFDESGNMALAWTFAHGKVASFWEPSNSAGQPGDSFVDFNDKANPKRYQCHKNGACEAAVVHYEYADAAKRNPLSAEWRDASGNLLYGAYYSYQFDGTGNWTHREISVWNAELGTRTPYETDERLISYWE